MLGVGILKYDLYQISNKDGAVLPIKRQHGVEENGEESHVAHQIVVVVYLQYAMRLRDL